MKLSAVLLVAATLVAAPVGAQPPPGSAETCPGPYQAMTLPQILAQAQSYDVPEERARAMFEGVNKNEDAWICQDTLPGAPPSFNFIDNQAIGTP